MDETERAIAQAKKEVEEAVIKTVKSIALKANQIIILSTPVDTGRARANWIASVDKPNTKKLDDTDKSGSVTIADNNKVIISAPEEMGLEIHISNNLDYIIPLNNGHSAQAPAGFVEKAVQLAANEV